MAGYLEGKLEVSVPSLAAGGALILRFNNTGSAVNKEIKLGSDKIKISFDESEGTIFSVSLLGGSLDFGGVMSVEGDISFSSQNGYEVFGGENMTLFVGEGNLRLDSGELNPFAKGLMISEATIGVIEKDGKYALSAKGQVSVVGISGLSLSGPISMIYNGFDHLVEETVAIAETAKRVAVEFADDQVAKVVGEVRKAFYQIKGFEAPIAIDVAGQRVRANFSVRRFASVTGGADDSMEFELTNVESSFGDERSNFVTLVSGSGVLLSMPGGVALTVSGDVSVSAPDVSLIGAMDLRINELGVAVNQGSVNLIAGPYAKFEGSGLSLVVADQTLLGDFVFEKDSNGDVRGAVEGGGITITDTGRDIITLSKINGSFEMTGEGSYGALRVGKSTFAVPGVTMSGGTVTVQINTVGQEKTGDFDLGGVSAETLTFGAGPYLRVDLKGSSLLLEGLMSNGVDAELIGNFAFEQSEGVTKVGMINVSSSVSVNEDSGTLEQGKGVMLVSGNGVAGILEGKLAVSLPDLDSGGTLIMRFNNTGFEIEDSVQLGSDKIKILFGESERNFLGVSLLGLSLNIGGVVTIEGDVSFNSQKQDGYDVFAGEQMTLFIGESKLRLDNGELNPFARGLMISDATVGLLKKDDKYAMSAQGKVSVVGISGLSLSGPISINYNGFTEVINQVVTVVETGKQVAVDFVASQVATAQKSFYEIKGFDAPIACLLYTSDAADE